jgi:16S rRNA (guanine966-N2)-methyltransferase
MRIIAGELRGRRLSSPAGRDVRPTSDRAREALFSILEHGQPPVRGARFLDLFCGTGAVGLEAFSRGAAEVLLVESEADALRVATSNLERVGAPGNVRLSRQDATRLGPAPAAFDILFLDPPYRSGLAGSALECLRRGCWLAPEARVVVELAADEALEFPDGYELEQERRYGAAKFLLLRCQSGEEPSAPRSRSGRARVEGRRADAAKAATRRSGSGGSRRS